MLVEERLAQIVSAVARRGELKGATGAAVGPDALAQLGRVSHVSYAAFDDVMILTCGDVSAEYRARKNVVVVGE